MNSFVFRYEDECETKEQDDSFFKSVSETISNTIFNKFKQNNIFIEILYKQEDEMCPASPYLLVIVDGISDEGKSYFVLPLKKEELLLEHLIYMINDNF